MDVASPRGRHSPWREIGIVVLATATLVLGSTAIGVARTVADGAPDDVTPVRDSLALLRSKLDAGSATAAQQQFPEGYFFSYALFGLAWTDLAAGDHAATDVAAARTAARWALEHMESADGRRGFDPSLVPSFGIFHAGWTLLLRAQAAELAGSSLEPAERAEVSTEAATIARAFASKLDGRGSPFLTAYPGQSWPVDSVVAIAALRRADRATGDDHGAVIRAWLERAASLLDPRTGLLPHQTDPVDGRLLQGSRGTSQSIVQRLWPMVDPSTAAVGYERFRAEFVTSSFGIVGVREYPEGVDGSADVDSGPLVDGMSASATAVSIGAARANGDADLAVSIVHEADVFGLPLTIGGERGYLFGVVPIGDAFVTWARAAPIGPDAPAPAPSPRASWLLVVLLPWPSLAGLWLLAWRTRPSTARQR